jgi:transposase InsO family protein
VDSDGSDSDSDDNMDAPPPPGHLYGRRLSILVHHALHYDKDLVTQTTLHHMRERLQLSFLAEQISVMTDTDIQDVVLVSRYAVPPTGQVVLRVLDHQLAPIDYGFDLFSELFFFVPDAYPDPPHVNSAPTRPGSEDDYQHGLTTAHLIGHTAPPAQNGAAAAPQNRQSFADGAPDLDLAPTDALDKGNESGTSMVHALTASSSKNRVVLDSGASRHVEPLQAAFSSRSPCSPVHLRGISGPAGTLNHSGQVGNFIHVLHAPTAVTSVRSVGAILDARSDRAIVFTATEARLIPAPPTSTADVIARREEDGLYHIVPGAMPAPTSTATVNFTVAGQVRREQVHQLHRVLGHASPHVMRLVLQNNPRAPSGLRPSDVRLFSSCDACHQGKAKRQPRPSLTTTRATSFGYRIHTDTTGRITPATKSAYQYANISVDDASRFVFTTPLRGMTKEETTTALRQVLRKIAAHESTLPTKVLRSDNGTELINSSVATLLASANITHERTCPGTSSQNGVAERTIGVLFAATRTLLIDAALPPVFWCEALMTATFVHNRLPTSANPNNASPFEMRYGRVPDMRRLRPFGITAYVRVRTHLTKIQPRALRGLFLGYGDDVSGQKGWRVYVPSKQRVFTSADVTFALDLRRAVHSRPAELISAAVPTMEAQLPISAVSHHGLHSVGEPAIFPPDSVNHARDQPRGSLTRPPQLAANTTAMDASNSSPAPVLTRQQRQLVTDLAPRGHPVSRLRPAFDPHAMPTSAWRAQPWIDHNSPMPQTGGGLTTATVATTPPPPLITPQHPGFAAFVITASTSPDLASQYETPPTFLSATTGPEATRWKASIKRELASLKNHSVFKIVPRSSMPSGAKPIKCKWVFRVKQTSDGAVDKFKSRLTACGYAQRYGRDFTETFAPVASTASIRLTFILAALYNLQLHQFDISTAFLYGILPENERVYLNVPEGLETPPDSVCLCLRGLYGLKQSPRLFNEHLDASLRHIGFTKSTLDPCVYYYRCAKTNTLSFAAIVVDDILLCTNDPTHAQRFQDMLETTYKLTTMGQPEWMIGLKVQKQDRTITLNQERYIMDIASKFGQTDCKPVSTPADSQTNLRILTGDPLDSTKYNFLSLVGSLMWATLTRPDISAAVSRVAQFTAAPIWAHWKAGIRILRYLVHSRTLGLVYNGHSIQSTQVYAYADSAWGNERKGRSRYGFITLLGSCPISWCSKVTSMTCLSTAEAEYVAATEATKELTWLRNLLTELGIKQPNPSIIHEDNQACIRMATNPVISARNRHFGIKMHWIRDQVAAGVISLVYVPTDKQLADIFTKTLNKALFILNRDQLVKDTTLDS